jgi:hypothetical protein
MAFDAAIIIPAKAGMMMAEASATMTQPKLNEIHNPLVIW